MKIPSMGSLGMVSTVFRADRTTDFTDFLRVQLGKPCYIVHGAAVAGSGIHHLASAAFCMNNHGIKARTLVRIRCSSARYIQYWGMHGGSMDGGEVLIPAGTICYYDGQPPTDEPFADETKPAFTLVEVSRNDVKPNIPFFDDFKGQSVGQGVLDKLAPGLRALLERKNGGFDESHP